MGTQERAIAEQRFAHWILIGGHHGNLSEESKTALTVDQLWQVYWEKHVEKEASAPDSIRFAWNNLKVHFGAMTLADITQDAVDDYEEKRAEGAIGRPAKASTVRKELVSLRACLNYCAESRHRPKILDKADLPDFDLPPEGDPKDRWLKTNEIKALYVSAAKLRTDHRLTRCERFLWLALETAARKQAILDLTWDRVDFETGVIHYDVPGRKKTKKRRPSVAISDTLLPVLHRAHKERKGDLVLDHGGSVWASVQIVVERSGLVPARTEVRETGMKPKATGISPHTFRHTAATQMARRGVPLYDIAGVLGNTLAMVEKVYAKHCPGRLRAAVNSISSGVLEPAE